MEQPEGSAPVESVEGGDYGGEAYAPHDDAPPWFDAVSEDFTRQLGKMQQEQPYEPDGYDDDAIGGERFDPDALEGDGLGAGDLEGDEGDAFDLDQFANDFAPDDDAVGEDEQAFRDHLADQLGQDQWKTQMHGRLDELEAQHWSNEMDGLLSEFPGLERPENAVPLFEAMTALAQDLDLPDKFALSPQLARTVHLAMRAEAQMAREKPAGPGSDVVLEQGGVADPGTPEPENEFSQLAREGHRQRRPGRHNPNQPFSWEK